MATPQPTPEEVISCTNIAFEWAESYDTKDWARLAACLAPTITEDYRSIGGPYRPDVPSSELVSRMSGPTLLGNPRIKSQHLLGATKWEKVSETEVRGSHQIRAAHQLYKDDACTEVECQGNAYGMNVFLYEKQEGAWKLKGLQVNARWAEYEMGRIFPGSI